MSKITWDGTNEKVFENGVSHGVLYKKTDAGAYGSGVAWNGITSVAVSPDGGDATDLWADNIKYGSLRAAENHKGTIEAYTYPDEFAECEGYAEPIPGVKLSQQPRRAFGFCYRTEVGNDSNSAAGYKLHIVYGATVSPSEKTYETVNDSPDAITFSWDYDTVPEAFTTYTDFKPTAYIELDSITFGDTIMKSVEAKLYGKDPTTTGGSDGAEPTLPTPDELLALLNVPAPEDN